VSESEGAAASPFAGVRVHHRVSAPPSSGLPRCSMPSRVSLAAVAGEGRRGSGSGCRRRRAPHLRGSARRKKGSPPPFRRPLFARVRVQVFPLPVPPLFCVLGLIPTLIYASRLGSDTIDRNRIATA
jgi:hypothetical protein